MERKSNLLPNAFVNPLYRGTEESQRKAEKQTEESKLGTVVEPRAERQSFVPKYKSVKPSASKMVRTTTRKAEEESEKKPTRGLTKVQPPGGFIKTVPLARIPGETSISDAVLSPRSMLLQKGRPRVAKVPEQAHSPTNESSSGSEHIAFASEPVLIAGEVKNLPAKEPGHEDLPVEKSDSGEFVERSEEFPHEEKIEELPNEEKNKDIPKQEKKPKPALSHRTRLSKVNPQTSNELVETIKYLMEVDQSSAAGTVRAMKALYSAAGGQVAADPEMSEIQVYKTKFASVPNDKRYEFLKPLFDELEPHLPMKERQDMRNSLTNLYSNTKIAKNDLMIRTELDSIRLRLKEQLDDLEDKSKKKKT
ncbi:hypothetical protein H4CHR_00270 [Variovorax sp. PBS-H4]|uniref:hypothetical protein n=1 Tax=Variovorax sp. PBS-H4 TaxID=434008 RepID=UPI001317F032|nr:hypothetical protein [Variovorax sp. PBS-H4]VTU18862.1 hypothetical protein H4CHR_00270 [Variovorax sp. PBS-H4]